MLTLIVYLPGTGGNHLKNLLCLSDQYANHNDLTPKVYTQPDPKRPSGEVWCVGGRNLQDIFFERMQDSLDHKWVLAAHLGEMFQYQTELTQIVNKKIVIITFNDAADRHQLHQRHNRLGQNIHPYWLDEELVWLYKADSVSRLFDADDQYYSIDLTDFWHVDFVNRESFLKMKKFLDIDLDCSTADHYHKLWVAANKFM